MFDGVKGSPSIRQGVLILALGRFSIDYLISPKHSTSLDRPMQQRSINHRILLIWRFGSGCVFGSSVTPSKNSQMLLFWGKGGKKNCKCILQQASPTYSLAFVIVEQRRRCRESGIPACIHKEPFRPANKQQRDTETLLKGGGGG